MHRKRRYGKLLCAPALSAALLLPQGCAQYHLTIPDSDPIQLEGQDQPYVTATLDAYFWGLVLDPQVLAAECQGQGINDLFIERTFAQDLASVLTLGIWMPLEVRFRCKAPPPRSGVFPSPAGQ